MTACSRFTYVVVVVRSFMSGVPHLGMEICGMEICRCHFSSRFVGGVEGHGHPQSRLPSHGKIIMFARRDKQAIVQVLVWRYCSTVGDTR